MPRLIFISPHFKSGAESAAHLSYLVRYIATRDGAAPAPATDGNQPSTQKQAQLIHRLVRDFPLTKKRFEYQDYLASPTIANASDFIGIALEQNLDQIGKRENYVDYIGTRPGAFKMGAHGLFDGSGRALVLSQVQKEISEHPGVVWTPVISLHREDAQAMGYESPERWRTMLSACAADLAKAYKITPEHLRWYASFHDQTHHPHVHMILYSTDPNEGFLTKEGIAQVKSALARSIFPEQLQELYAADTRQRDALKAAARMRYQALVAQMLGGTLQSERIEILTAQLVKKLTDYRGKMQYGYLQAPVKAIVDAIVDELAKEPHIAEAYDLWFTIRADIYSTYQDRAMERPPLSAQKEFKPVRNMVVAEAARLIGAQQLPSGTAPGKTDEALMPAMSDRPAQQQATNPAPPQAADAPPSAIPSTAAEAATRLLHHMGRIFQDNTPPMHGGRLQLDKKLQRQLKQKKIAQGHKADDHEQEQSYITY